MSVWFTTRDVRRQLAQLGYVDVPDDVLAEFTEDLIRLALQQANATSHAEDEAVSYSQKAQQPYTSRQQHTTHDLKDQRPDQQYRPSSASSSSSFLSASKSPSSRLRIHPDTISSPRAALERPSRRPDHGRASLPLRTLNTSQTSAKGRPRKTALMDGSVLEAVEQNIEQEKDGLVQLLDEMESMTVQSDIFSDVNTEDIYDVLLEDALDYDSMPSDGFEGHPLPPVPSVDEIRPMAARTSVIPQRKPPGPPKADVVSKASRYREAWQKQKAPGEDKHSRLRWQVRQQLEQQKEEPYQRPRNKPLQRNDYVVPTSKKRLPLRWAVRMHINQLT
eukprot:m.83140 g.83140  ORF g.83140 m.83140 type:complete len:333 (-) comp14334_c0_seq2:128-1126(-)